MSTTVQRSTAQPQPVLPRPATNPYVGIMAVFLVLGSPH